MAGRGRTGTDSMSDDQEKGIVFNMQRYSVHDGPGIRTIVFFKGCPLRCTWCSNPESQGFTPELAYNKSQCLGCATCVKSCEPGWLRLEEDGLIIDRQRCPARETPCVKACPAGALTVYGQERTVAQVLDEAEEDSAFYARSGGGITLSGGEALAQPRFALALLREAKKRRLHSALETSALTDAKTMAEAVATVDYLLADIKCLDPETHKRGTGVDNAQIMANVLAIKQLRPKLPLKIRTPVIPGFNDSERSIADIAAFAARAGADAYELLPSHRMGEQKSRCLGTNSAMASVDLDEILFNYLKNIAEERFGQNSAGA